MSKMSKKQRDMEAKQEAADRELLQRAQEIVNNTRLAGMVIHLWLEKYGYHLLPQKTHAK